MRSLTLKGYTAPQHLAAHIVREYGRLNIEAFLRGEETWLTVAPRLRSGS
jgi:hypothetical protein